MKKQIVIDINDLKSFDRAIEEIEKFEKWVQKKTDELIERLADVGVSVATQIAAPAAVYDGNDEIEVYKEQTGNGAWRIVATGNDIYFIEFGAGVGVDATNPFVSQATVDVFDGSYSAEHNGPYIRQGFWYYNNVGMNGITARKPMYLTQKEIEENLVRIAREVFDSD